MTTPPDTLLSRWYFRAVIGVFVALAVYLAMPSARPPSDLSAAIARWNPHSDALGNAYFLGVAVGSARLVDTRTRFHAAPDIGLMISRRDGEPQRQLEAYYRELDDDDGRLVLTLDGPSAVLDQIEAARFNPYEYDSGTMRFSVPVRLLHDVGQFTVSSMTYVADGALPMEQLQRQFGPADHYRIAGTSEQHWVFPRLGMDVIQASNEPTVIQIVEPRRITRLVASYAATALDTATALAETP